MNGINRYISPLYMLYDIEPECRAEDYIRRVWEPVDRKLCQIFQAAQQNKVETVFRESIECMQHILDHLDKVPKQIDETTLSDAIDRASAYYFNRQELEKIDLIRKLNIEAFKVCVAHLEGIGDVEFSDASKKTLLNVENYVKYRACTEAQLIVDIRSLRGARHEVHTWDLYDSVDYPSTPPLLLFLLWTMTTRKCK